MKRFELDLYQEYVCVTNEGMYIWRPSQDDLALVDWLMNQVGSLQGSSYDIPMRGKGWSIHLGYGEDPNLDDFAWRNFNIGYRARGQYGYWLQVDDDDAAMLLRLSGVLDPCLYDPAFQHRDYNVAHARKAEDPSYPAFRRR